MEKNIPNSWSELVKTTRKSLDITRERFAIFLGISIHTLSEWEYRNKVPSPVYQNVVCIIYKNRDAIREMLSEDKTYFKGMGAGYCPSDDNSDFWESSIEKKMFIGVLLLLERSQFDERGML